MVPFWIYREAYTCVQGKEWKERKFTLCTTTGFGKQFSGFFNLDFQLRIWYHNIQGHHPNLFDDTLEEKNALINLQTFNIVYNTIFYKEINMKGIPFINI